MRNALEEFIIEEEEMGEEEAEQVPESKAVVKNQAIICCKWRGSHASSG